MTRPPRRQRGMTLVELMVVIAILGVLVALMITPSRSFGATTSNVSEQIASSLGFARMRAGSTRRIHRVQVQPTAITVYQSPNTGLVLPTSGWQVVQTTTFSSNVSIWNAQAGAQVSSGASPARNASLNYLIDFRPDGRATASTIFLTNAQQSSKYRVLVYGATGGSYARQSW